MNQVIELAVRLNEATRRHIRLRAEAEALGLSARNADREAAEAAKEADRLGRLLMEEVTGYRWNPETSRMELDGVSR